MPVVDSLDELNDRIRAWEEVDQRRKTNDRIRTIGEDFAAEQLFLAPLPRETFDPGVMLTPRVDRSSMITARMVRYSVPARLIGRKVRVSLRASEVLVFDGKTVAARHARLTAKGAQSVQLDHYLEVLKTKPGHFRDPPLWPGHAKPAHSLQPMKRSGLPRAGSTVMPNEPGS